MTRNDRWLGLISLHRLAAAALIAAALGTPAFAQNNPGEPERFRGVVTRADASSLAIRTGEGKALHFALPEGVAVFALSKASFADIDFGLYVGAVSERMGDTFSPSTATRSAGCTRASSCASSTSRCAASLSATASGT